MRQKARVFLILIIMTVCYVFITWYKINAPFTSRKGIYKSHREFAHNLSVPTATTAMSEIKASNDHVVDLLKLFFHWPEEKVPRRCMNIAEENLQRCNKSGMSATQLVNPHRYAYLINPCTLCVKESVRVVIATPTAPDDFQGRVLVRQKNKAFIHRTRKKVRLLFFLGTTNDSNPDLQSKLDAEFAVFGDIVQEDFVDSYHNLSLKSVAILRWAALFCPQSKFFIKSDADVAINRQGLVDALTRQNAHHNKFILGREGGKKPIRNITSKWYVSLKTYPHTSFPTFVVGPTYGFTTNAALDLFLASLQEPFFHLEDVYVTGFCAKRAGITVLKDPGFRFSHIRKL